MVTKNILIDVEEYHIKENIYKTIDNANVLEKMMINRFGFFLFYEKEFLLKKSNFPKIVFFKDFNKICNSILNREYSFFLFLDGEKKLNGTEFFKNEEYEINIYKKVDNLYFSSIDFDKEEYLLNFMTLTHWKGNVIFWGHDSDPIYILSLAL